MQDFAEDNVRPRMERVPGVSRVDVSGGAPREVRIKVGAARPAERGITLVDLRDAVRARNRVASAGDIDSGKRRYLVRTLGRIEKVENAEDMIHAARRLDLPAARRRHGPAACMPTPSSQGRLQD